MKNKFGIISGFVIGIIIGFIIIFLVSQLHPEEDLAGLVIFTCFICGFVFSLTGYFFQNIFEKKKK